jgi:uncharacterized protein
MFTDSTGKLKPVWAFVFSIILAALAFLVSGNIASETVGKREFLFELIFRPLWVLLLFGIFFWMLTVGDHVEEHRLAAQGLPTTKGWVKQFVSGCVIGCVLTVVAIAPVYHWGQVKSKNFLTLHLVPKVGMVLVILLCGALAEELIFRGYPFQHLVRGIGAVRAIVVFSILYGVLHLLNPGAGRWGVVTTILIGVVLAIAYLRTRALWLSWGIHFGWNTTLGFLFGFPVSGYRVFNVIRRSYPVGPDWLTGGNYGVEAGATGTIAILVGMLIVSFMPVSRLPEPVAMASTPEPALSSSLSGIKP